MKTIFYVIALFGMLIGISACKNEHTHNIVSYEEKEPTCIESGHISGDKLKTKIYLGTNAEGIGATFIGGINSFLTLNSLLSEGVGYYDANGNLIEVADNLTEIIDQGDITIKRNN